MSKAKRLEFLVTTLVAGLSGALFFSLLSLFFINVFYTPDPFTAAVPLQGGYLFFSIASGILFTPGGSPAGPSSSRCCWRSSGSCPCISSCCRPFTASPTASTIWCCSSSPAAGNGNPPQRKQPPPLPGSRANRGSQRPPPPPSRSTPGPGSRPPNRPSRSMVLPIRQAPRNRPRRLLPGQSRRPPMRRTSRNARRRPHPAWLSPKRNPGTIGFRGFVHNRTSRADQRLLNWGARRAALRPYFNRLSDDFP